MKSFWKHFFLDNGDIALIEAGLQKFFPNQVNNYKVKHDLVFHIVLDGKDLYSVNNTDYHLQANDGFIHKKNQRVYYVPDENDPWTICWIGIGGRNLNNYLKHTIIPDNDVLSFKENSQLLQEMEAFVNYLLSANPSNQLDYLKTFSQLYNIL